MLNKHNLAIAELADNDIRATRYGIDGVRVTPDETVVTDGCALVRVSAVKHEEMREEFEPFTIPAEHALEVAAAMEAAEQRNEWNEPKVPFPATLAEGEDGTVEIRFSDAKSHGRRFEIPKLTKPFPNWRAVVPAEGEEAVFVDVNLDLLIPVLKRVRKFCRGENGFSQARIRLYASDRQIRVDAENDYGQTMTAVVMPLKPPAKPEAEQEPESVSA